MNKNEHITPPKWPLRFLRFFVKKDYLEEIEGDMEEVFQDSLEMYSERKAEWLYTWETLKLLKPILVRNLEGTDRLNQFAMFKNHFKTAIRSFKREKAFTLINVLGLTFGICCSLLISLWVMDEFNHDNFHAYGKNIYQVMRNSGFEDGKINTAFGTSYPIGDALLQNVPEIKDRTRLSRWSDAPFNFADELVQIDLIGVDSSFFDIFSFALKEGVSGGCLSGLNNMIISEELAETYFPNESAIGKTVFTTADGQKINLIIAGVFEKIPENSQLQFDVVIRLENFLPFNTTYKSWGNSWMTTYVLLDDQADIAAVNDKIRDLPNEIAQVDWFTLLLHPFTDMYLYSKFENGKVAGGQIDNVILFSIIALFTLLIACFNFINLTTARSGKRSKEIGIKKVMGAGKSTLISQFVLESILLVSLSVLLAVLLAQLILPFFNNIADKRLFIDYFDFSFYLILASVALATILFSGLYPAIFLSSFQAINALKGRLKGNTGQSFLRRGLVVFQFTLSMILVAGTIVVFLQLSFIQNKNLGLDKENVIYSPLDINTREHYQSILSELSQHSSINVASSASSNFVDGMGMSSDPTWEGKSPDAGQLWFSIMDVDMELIEMLDIQLKEGRLFSQEVASDSLNYLINEEAATLMGLENPVGTDLSFWGEKGGRIIGVVNDFHYTNMHNIIFPLIIRCRPSETELLYIKTEPERTNEALAHLQTVHEEFSTLPFEFHFLDETIENGYREEQRTQRIAGGFSALAIFISCLGLLGLASFTATQRTKEIAVRKVLGAKILNLISLLFKEYFRLIIVSAFIAVPIAYHWTSKWLDGFVYRIDQAWWIYTLPGIIVLFIAMLTVGKLSFKTANTNPADSLRDE